MRVNSYIFVNGVEIYKLKAKSSEINAATICLGNVSEDFSFYNIKKIGLHGNVYVFSVNYDSIDVADTLDIHKDLMKKHDIKQLF